MLPKPFDKEKIFKDLDDAWHYFYYFDRLSELKSDDAYYINALFNYIEYLGYINSKQKTNNNEKDNTISSKEVFKSREL